MAVSTARIPPWKDYTTLRLWFCRRVRHQIQSGLGDGVAQVSPRPVTLNILHRPPLPAISVHHVCGTSFTQANLSPAFSACCHLLFLLMQSISADFASSPGQYRAEVLSVRHTGRLKNSASWTGFHRMIYDNFIVIGRRSSVRTFGMVSPQKTSVAMITCCFCRSRSCICSALESHERDQRVVLGRLSCRRCSRICERDGLSPAPLRTLTLLSGP